MATNLNNIPNQPASPNGSPDSFDQWTDDHPETTTSPETSQPTTTPPGTGTDPLDTTPSGRQGIEFSHPKLKGKTAAEIEQLFSLTDAAVVAQRRELDAFAERPAPAPTQSTPENPQELFTEPRKLISEIVREEMDRAIAPFRQDLAKSKVQEVVDELRARHPDFDYVKSNLDLLVERTRTPRENLPAMDALYYTAKGIMHDQGVYNYRPDASPRDFNANSNPDPNPADRGQPMSIPQHRPSTAPPPTARPSTPALPPLTEEEQTLRRFYKMNEADFRAMQNVAPEDVVNSDIALPPHIPPMRPGQTPTPIPGAK
jgi:hypothetical protein